MTRYVVESIQLPSSKVKGEKPPATLKHGELWVNTADKLLYAGLDGAAPIAIDSAGVPDSVTKAIQALQSDATATKADLGKVKTAIKPILDHGLHTAGGAAAAGGVPVLDRVGQIPPTMIGGTDKQPARAGEVPKFKKDGKLDPGLIDYNFASVSSPSTGRHTPTAADAQKLVRLDAQGKLDSSLLGLDPLNYKGELKVGPAGTALTGEALNGNGVGGTIWIVAADGAKTYDVNFNTGAVVEHTGATPAGSLEIKTGDLLVKSNDRQIHRINADLIPTAHLLPRDGSRAMIGNLIFQKTGTSATHNISGVQTVSAQEGHFHKLVAEMVAGTPGVANGEIEDFLIDGEKNVIRFRHGGDPRLGRVDGKKGEVYIDSAGVGMRIFFCVADGPNWLEGVSPLLAESIDLTSYRKAPGDDVAKAFGYYFDAMSVADKKLKEDVIYLAAYEVEDANTVSICLRRGGSSNSNDWTVLGSTNTPPAEVGRLGVVSPDGSTLKVDANGVLSVDDSIANSLGILATQIAGLEAALTALKADYDAYKVAHP